MSRKMGSININITNAQASDNSTIVSIQQPQPLPLPPAQVFPPNLDLQGVCLGRDDEIAQLKEKLLDQIGSVALVALQGMGGIGKTRLALEFIRRHQQDFPGGVFWLRAENDAQREEQFYNILCLLKPHTPNIADLRAHKRDISAMLSQAVAQYQPGQRRLWVLDNVPEVGATQRATDLNPWRPVNDAQTSLLITSRQAVRRQGLTPMTVHPLSQEAAVNLLIQNCKSPSAVEIGQACEIAAWVGYLPLALELISYSIPNPWTLNDWHQRISKDASPEVERILTDLGDSIPEGVPGIVEVFLKSYELLNPEAQVLARILAHFGTDPIPNTLIAALGKSASQTELGRLRNRHFIVGVSNEFVGAMHRLLADFLRHVVGLEKTENDRTYAREALLVAMPWDMCQNPRQRHVINPIQQHALIFLQRPEIFPIEDIQLSERVARIFSTKGDDRSALPFEQKALAVRRRVLGDDHPDTLTAMGNLAQTLYAMGDLVGARRYQEQTLDGLKRVLGDDHPDTLTAMGNLAGTLKAMGDLVGARRYEEQTLAVRKRVLGDDHPSTLTAMNNLAGTLKAMGDLVGARRYQEQTLAVRKRVLGDDHPSTLIAKVNLAQTLHHTGERQRALDLSREALAGFQKKLGADHPTTQQVQAIVDRLSQTEGQS
jgi:tetratricopeptide (TPR) repeat protein